MYGDCPHDIDAEEALAGMRRDKPAYDGVPSNLASYDARKLKILRKCTQPQHITQFLPPQAAAMVKSCFKSHQIHWRPSVPTGTLLCAMMPESDLISLFNCSLLV